MMQNGVPVLHACKGTTKDDAVFRTHFGYRGSNEHTGDIQESGYAEWSGRDIVTGVIADGQAGNMALPCGRHARTAYSGRLYGEPQEHFWLGVTASERCIYPEFDAATIDAPETDHLAVLQTVQVLRSLLGADVGSVDVTLFDDGGDNVRLTFCAARERDGLTFEEEYMSVDEFVRTVVDLASHR